MNTATVVLGSALLLLAAFLGWLLRSLRSRAQIERDRHAHDTCTRAADAAAQETLDEIDRATVDDPAARLTALAREILGRAAAAKRDSDR